MKHPLDDLVRYNTWASTQLIDYCAGLDQSTLTTRLPGTYGPIIDTFRHIIDSEMSYLFRLTGAWPERPWQADEPVGLNVLRDRAMLLGDTFATYLSGNTDPDVMGESRSSRGEVFATAHGIFVSQIIYHGCEHRAQICTILGSFGFEVPDIQPWMYAFAFERSILKYIEEPAG